MLPLLRCTRGIHRVVSAASRQQTEAIRALITSKFAPSARRPESRIQIHPIPKPKKFSTQQQYIRLYSTSNSDELKVITKKELENKIKSSPNEFCLIDVRDIEYTNRCVKSHMKLHKELFLPQNSYRVCNELSNQEVRSKYLRVSSYTVGHVFAAMTNPYLDWEDAFGFPKPELDDEVIFYCRSGKRSYQACMLAKQFGYKNIKNYEGSWLEWSGQS